jgi:hypothetical protein
VFRRTCPRTSLVFSVALGAREVKENWLILLFLIDGPVRMEELVGEVAEDGGAAGRDASSGDLNDETGEEFLDVLAGGKFVESREEVGGEILGVAWRRRKSDGGVAQAEMMPAQAGLRF